MTFPLIVVLGSRGRTEMAIRQRNRAGLIKRYTHPKPVAKAGDCLGARETNGLLFWAGVAALDAT